MCNLTLIFLIKNLIIINSFSISVLVIPHVFNSHAILDVNTENRINYLWLFVTSTFGQLKVEL